MVMGFLRARVGSVASGNQLLVFPSVCRLDQEPGPRLHRQTWNQDALALKALGWLAFVLKFAPVLAIGSWPAGPLAPWSWSFRESVTQRPRGRVLDDTRCGAHRRATLTTTLTGDKVCNHSKGGL